MNIAIFTLGCKTNQYESELIRESFENAGHTIVPFKEKADIYVINSCVVTQKAEAETRKAVHHAYRTNPEARIILTGCFANLHKNFKEKNTILYNGEKKKIMSFIENNKIYPIEINEEMINKFSNHTRATIKIEEGCDNFCTYCIVPLVRGNKIRSKKIEIVLKESEALAKNGFEEIVLTGTEIGKYGKDIGTELAELLKELKTVKGIKRIRISSIYPTAVTDKLIEQIEPPIVPHLHMSLQSGDNRILERMKRNYTREVYMGIVNKLRKKDPLFSISTDIIVGFPGEDEEAFLNSLYMIKRVLFSKVHIFRYSRRPFTPAYFMKETVSESTKKIRATRTKEMVYAVQKEYKDLFLKKQVEVLTEEKIGEFYYGFTPYYTKVKFKSQREIIQGEIVKVLAERADSSFIYGEAVNL
jgi:threonylcarbamoyladenosine tRNA methylthiotransferase MtaB